MTFVHATRFTFSLLMVAVFASLATAQTERVALKASTSISSSIVLLGDVASIEVSNVALREELAGIELMPAPSADQTTYLTINDVRSILAARGISSEMIEVTGSSRVRMQAAAEGDVAPTNSTAKRLPRRTFGGRQVVDQPQEVITVAHVVRNVRRGEVIQASDVEMRELTVIRRDDAYPTSIHNVIGKQVTRGIAADRPIASEDIRQPVIVRRNEVVTVFAHAGNVVVRREMMALNDAGLQELVEVQPIQPKHYGRAREVERFQAQVSGPGEAIVLGGHINVPTAKPLMPLPKTEINR